MKAKILAVIQYFFTRGQTMELSITKLLGWVSTLCISVVSFRDTFVTWGVAVPPEFLPIIKAAGIISAFIALVKIRNGQTAAPTPPAK